MAKEMLINHTGCSAMTNEIVKQEPEQYGIVFNEEKLALLKGTICKGATNDELQLFIHACKRTGLDPFMRQIHAVKRWDSALKREAMAIQTGIDGYRLIAERTGKYVPGRETSYQYDNAGKLVSATAYVKKQTADGTWHEVSATAFWSEYVALKKDGTPNSMWGSKPHIMLGKCAEALALRKAFPADLSGIYTSEEMEQASNAANTLAQATISDGDIMDLEDLISRTPDPVDTKSKIINILGTDDFKTIPQGRYAKLVEWIKSKIICQEPANDVIDKTETVDVSVDSVEAPSVFANSYASAKGE